MLPSIGTLKRARVLGLTARGTGVSGWGRRKWCGLPGHVGCCIGRAASEAVDRHADLWCLCSSSCVWAQGMMERCRTCVRTARRPVCSIGMHGERCWGRGCGFRVAAGAGVECVKLLGEEYGALCGRADAGVHSCSYTERVRQDW